MLAPLVITLDDTLVASSCRPIQIDSCWLDKENKMRSPEIEPRPKICTFYFKHDFRISDDCNEIILLCKKISLRNSATI